MQPAQQLIQARRENEAKKGNPQCVYSCMQFAGVQCKEQKCITRTYFPPQANRPQSVDDEDLERFRENPDETREILQKRRSYVDEYLNGTQYQGCSLSANGKYVVCLDPVAPSSGT
ncbi:MAG: hypothetical protein LBP53_01885 [Candidatus Peribacteria bacterium]|nr:hypothetical protein [Candidatus Peribacteria bacterium]